MFVEITDRSTLRQADIIADIFFPLPRIENLRFIGTFTRQTEGSFELEATKEVVGRSECLIGQIPAVRSLGALFSQCCEIDSKQQHPPPTFLLCRVQRVTENQKKQKSFDVLKSNIDPYGEGRPYYPLFYLGTIEGYDGEFLADFGQIMSVQWKDYDTVLRKRVAQMDDVSRAKFRVKAGAYVGRPTPEDAKAGIADPWKNVVDPRLVAPEQNRIHRAIRVLLGKE